MTEKGTPPKTQKELLAELNAMDLESDELPEGIADLGPDATEEQKGKAAHAFKTVKDKLRLAKAMVEEQAEVIEKGKPSAPATPVNSSVPQNPEVQAQLYAAQLEQRAMQSLGIANPESPLVKMEVQRLYGLDRTVVDRQRTAEKDAKTLLGALETQFPQLEKKDWEALGEQLSGMEVLDRANEELVKEKIYSYLGQHMDRFTKPSKPGAGPAAASTAKARGTGVAPGDGAGETDTEAPPTAEELKEMRKMKIPPAQVGMFRRAKKKSGNYATT